MEIHNFENLDQSVKAIVWLGNLYDMPATEIQKILEEYRKRSTLDGTALQTGSINAPSQSSTHTDNQISELQNQVTELRQQVNFSLPAVQPQVEPQRRTTQNQHQKNAVFQREPITEEYHNQTRSRLNNRRRSYSSIGAILTLPENRSHRISSNIYGLIKAFSHPSAQFSGTGKVTENFGSYHQSSMNYCNTFKLTKEEAFNNLYVLFKTDSEAGRYYHKHVLN